MYIREMQGQKSKAHDAVKAMYGALQGYFGLRASKYNAVLAAKGYALLRKTKTWVMARSAAVAWGCFTQRHKGATSAKGCAAIACVVVGLVGLWLGTTTPSCGHPSTSTSLSINSGGEFRMWMVVVGYVSLSLFLLRQKK